ncbi:hypothetical protein BDW75DRAFT_104854 [Aspergillus navahoensis]
MLIEAVAQRNFGRLFHHCLAGCSCCNLAPGALSSTRCTRALGAWQRLSAQLCDRYSFLGRITIVHFREFYLLILSYMVLLFVLCLGSSHGTLIRYPWHLAHGSILRGLGHWG